MATTEAPPEAPPVNEAMEPEDETTFRSEPETAEPTGVIHQRMIAILAELPAIGKDSRNEQQSFMYRSHDDVLNALNPLLAKHGVYVVPNVLARETARRETRSGSTLYEVNLLVQYRFIAEDGSWIDASAWGEGTDSGDKSTNKAMTMAFKNVLAQSFAVSTAESQDTDGETPEETVAVGTAAAQAAAQAEAERAQAAAAEREATRGDRLRSRIGELCEALDVQTEAEKGTWATLVADAAQAHFGNPYETAEPPTLEEIGAALARMQKGGISKTPDQLDFSDE